MKKVSKLNEHKTKDESDDLSPEPQLPRLTNLEYWQWRFKATAIHLAQHKETEEKWKSAYLKQRMELQHNELKVARKKDVQTAISAYNECKTDIEKRLKISLTDCVIQDKGSSEIFQSQGESRTLL